MRKVNVYGFNIFRKSQVEIGNQSGDNLAVVASDPGTARADAVAFVGDDLANITGPTVIVERALCADLPDPPPTEPPVCDDTPHVSGTGEPGATLNCTMGNWSGEPTAYAYQWKSDGETDLGTDSDYTIVASDAGHSLTCVVTATNAAGSTEAPPSNAIEIAGAVKARHRK